MLRPWIDLVIFRVLQYLQVYHHQCYEVRHGIIVNGLMFQARLVFSMARNTRSHYLRNIIIIFISFVLIFYMILTIIIYQLLLFFSYRLLVPTFTSNRIPIDNHGSRFLLLGLRILGSKYCGNRFNISIQSPDPFYYLPPDA